MMQNLQELSQNPQQETGKMKESIKQRQLREFAQLELKQQKEREALEKEIAVLREKLDEKESTAASIAITTPPTPEKQERNSRSHSVDENLHVRLEEKLEEEEQKKEELEKLELQLEQLEKKLETLKINQESEKKQLEIKQQAEEKSLETIQQTKEKLLKLELAGEEQEQQRSHYQAFFDKSGIPFRGERFQTFLTAITGGEKCQKLVTEGKAFLKSKLLPLLNKMYPKEEEEKETTLLSALLSPTQLLKVAENLHQNFQLTLPSASSSQNDLIDTVFAIFGAIATSYSNQSGRRLATKLIQNLWAPYLSALDSKKTQTPQTLTTALNSLSIGDQKEKHALELKGKTGLLPSTIVSFAPPQATEIKATLSCGQSQKLMTNTHSTANCTICSSSSSLFSSPSTNSGTQLKAADKEEKDGEKHQPESKEEGPISLMDEIEKIEKERKDEVKNSLNQLDQKLISQVNLGENLNTFNEAIKMLYTQWGVANAVRSEDCSGKRLVRQILDRLDNLFVLAVIGDNKKYLENNDEFSDEDFSDEGRSAWWLEAACICGSKNVAEYLSDLIDKKGFQYKNPHALAYALSSGKESLAIEIAKFYKKWNTNSERDIEEDIGLFHYYNPTKDNVSLEQIIELIIM